jgi:hypothetical protein
VAEGGGKVSSATIQDRPSRIGIAHVHAMWSRVCLPSGGGQEADAAAWARDQLVIDGLGLARRETYAFLHAERSDFPAFEAWIADRAEHLAEPGRVAWINAHLAALAGAGPAPAIQPPKEAAREPGPTVFGAEALEFWDEHGYVVLRGAVSKALCRAAEQAIWDFTGADPSDPDSWYDGELEQGIMLPLVHHPAFSAVREVRAIRQAFAELWGTSDLLATTDRGGFNPPERAGWRFAATGLHWDTSLAPPMPLDIHGLVYLTDTPAEQGAFRCVPGFHRRLGPWMDALAPGSDPRSQPLDAEARPVAGSAGDLVLWRSALPHGASANRGLRPRMVIYIAMRPPGLVDGRPWI